MSDAEDNADEHHDVVQTLFDRTGGNELHWTKALYGLLKVNDVPISTPMRKSMKLLTRPWKESLDVSFEFFGSPDDFGSTHLKLSARGFDGFGDEQVGSITIWSKHLTEIEVQEEKETNHSRDYIKVKTLDNDKAMKQISSSLTTQPSTILALLASHSVVPLLPLETRDTTIKRANQIFRLYDHFASQQLAIRVPCCLYCQKLDHTTEKCKANVTTDEVCERSTCKKNGHNAKTCPGRICRNCAETGHSANECPHDLFCSRCGRQGHFFFKCESATRPNGKW
ncbi:hypothetical protein CDV36_009165 [Fusarium kuroshium]|uniref:CCHC-type domain-containing protein n=1 Tax=Fusarium kuroshium TaxID=2010991 RepID=A0A3M2S0Y1_9HYPO|nr:hypothetical protein CDV36_009165 [Fusarium kuroshium]